MGSSSVPASLGPLSFEALSHSLLWAAPSPDGPWGVRHRWRLHPLIVGRLEACIGDTVLS